MQSVFELKCFEDGSYLVTVMATCEEDVRLATVVACMVMDDIINYGRTEFHDLDEVVTSTADAVFFAGVLVNSNGTVRKFI